MEPRRLARPNHARPRGAGPGLRGVAVGGLVAILLAAGATWVTGGPRAQAAVGPPGRSADPAASFVPARATPTADVAGPVAPAPSAPSPTPSAAAESFPSLEPGLVLIGTWTVAYEPGPENGNGVNVRLPLRAIDRLVLRPGATFDFWDAVGEVSTSAGYRRGALVIGDHVDPDGALAGGICIVSSTVFNAAARAGLQIVTRRSHGGYLSRYPLGLDAAVFRSPGLTLTLAFRNDTDETIRIRTVSSRGISRVDLYAAHPLDRSVTFSEPTVSHRLVAVDHRVETADLPTGVEQRAQERSDGMTVRVTRTVRDASGRIVHADVFLSNYRRLTGLVFVGTG